MVRKKFSVFFYENQLRPDTFIYLVNSDNQRMCFLRKKTKIGETFPNKWRSLKPDNTMTKRMLYREEAGYIKIGVNVQRLNQAIRPSEIPINTMKFGQGSQRCRLVVDLICAEGLLASDDDGSVDPLFCISYLSNQRVSETR